MAGLVLQSTLRRPSTASLVSHLHARRFATAQTSNRRSIWDAVDREKSSQKAPPRLSLEEMEASTARIHPTSLRQLLREQPDRFRQPEDAQRLCALLPRVKGGTMYAYSALIRELVQLNFLREGVQFLIRMDAEGVKMTPQVFNIVLHAYAKQGSIDSMNDLVDIMKACDATPDLYTYSTLLNAYARQGDADSCQRVIQEMLQRKIKMDEHIMGNLIECFFKVNKQENALQVVEVLSSLGIVPSIATHNVIINQFVKHGQFNQAFAYYAGLHARHGVKPDELTYTPLMLASIKRGRPDEAIELFDALKRSGLQPNVQHYSLLVQARAEKNEFERAVAQLDEMAAGGVEVDDRLYFDYAKALLDRGRVREMADVCARMERVGQRLDRETGLRIVRFLDRVGTETATVRDHVESLLALVRVLHKHRFGYRPTNFLEPYLDECKKEEKPEEAVQFMQRVLKAREESGGEGEGKGGEQGVPPATAGTPSFRLHPTYFFAFTSQCRIRRFGRTRKLLEQLRDAGLFKSATAAKKPRQPQRD